MEDKHVHVNKVSVNVTGYEGDRWVTKTVAGTGEGGGC